MRTLATLAFIFSAQAFACPNLTGNFKCDTQQGSQTLSITQDTKGSVTVYTVNGDQIPADNQVRTLPDSDDIRNGTFRAWCDDDTTFKGQILGKYYYQGTYFGDLTANLAFTMDNGNLKQVTKGSVKGSSGTYPIDQTVVCKHM